MSEVPVKEHLARSPLRGLQIALAVRRFSESKGAFGMKAAAKPSQGSVLAVPTFIGVA